MLNYISIAPDEPEGPKKKPRILPGEEIDEKSKKVLILSSFPIYYSLWNFKVVSLMSCNLYTLCNHVNKKF